MTFVSVLTGSVKISLTSDSSLFELIVVFFFPFHLSDLILRGIDKIYRYKNREE